MSCFQYSNKRPNIFRVDRLEKKILEFFLHMKSMKIIKNTLKIEEKFSDVLKYLE